MRSDKQNQASRNNGAKSQGPATSEGKANSARNAATHNLCAGHLVLLTNEDPREFHRLQDDFLLRFQPIDGVESDLVHRMISATWREKRVTAMETALIELEMLRQQPDVDDEYSQITGPARQTLALFGTDDTKSAASLLYRYGSTARRAYASAFRALKELQGDRFNRFSPSSPTPLQPRQTQTNNNSTRHQQPQPNNNPPIPQNAGLAAFIVLRRRVERLAASPENTKLQNEPKRALAAGQAMASSAAVRL